MVGYTYIFHTHTANLWNSTNNMLKSHQSENNAKQQLTHELQTYVYIRSIHIFI